MIRVCSHRSHLHACNDSSCNLSSVLSAEMVLYDDVTVELLFLLLFVSQRFAS